MLAIDLAIGVQVYSEEAERRQEQEAFEKIAVMMQIFHLLQKDYVSGDKIESRKLIYSAIRGMVSSLDPFSSFMSPEDYTDMMENAEGQFGGLGIIVTIRDDALTVVTPLENTPGNRAGLLAGDLIVRIDGDPTRQAGDTVDLGDAVHRLKGEPGTAVTLTVYRPSTDETLDFTIVRELIEVPSVRAPRVLDGKIGYVRIVQFSEPTAAKLGEALDTLLEQDIRGLIIDMRNNPGGLLESAVDVCSFFLPPKSLIVSTEGRQPSQKHEFRTTRRRKFPNKPIAVLVNGGSASAAEIVAGCLQDTHRAVLVGEKTFGKGSVQSVVELPDGSALRMTTAMYHTPSRRVIHEHGIEPDIEVELTVQERRALMVAQREAASSGPLADPGADRQLQRAVDALNVYLQARGEP